MEVVFEDCWEIGFYVVFKFVFLIVSYFGNVVFEYVSYCIGELVFDVKEC